MRIRLSEPANPRYIYINPNTNTVHLMVPVALGTNIGLDNTCKTVLALQEFFGKRADSDQLQNSARHELTKYRNALQDDIAALGPDDPETRLKRSRLQQVSTYINTLTTLESHQALSSLAGGHPVYPEPIQELLLSPQSNLHAIHLKPAHQDNVMRTVAPVFTMNRDHNGHLYTAMMQAYSNVGHFNLTTNKDRFAIRVQEPLGRFLGQTVQAILANVIHQLNTTYRELFGIENAIDFTTTTEELETILATEPTEVINTPQNLQALVRGIIDLKAQAETSFPAESPFNGLTVPIVAEQLSMMTQFLLAEINVYAIDHRISRANFGRIVESNQHLSRTLVTSITTALEQGNPVEDAVCQFVNRNAVPFGLSAPLTTAQGNAISTLFRSHYETIKESPHMDEFMMLDSSKANNALFFTHQGSICCDFANLMNTNTFRNIATFNQAQAEVAAMPVEVPIREDEAVGAIEIDDNELRATIINAIEQNDFTQARKLFLVADNNQKVFEVLGREFFAQFDNNPFAKDLFLQLRRTITDAAISNHFNQIVRGQDAQLVLSREMARSLYVAVQDRKEMHVNRVLQYSTPESLQLIIEDLKTLGFYPIDECTITQGHNGDLVIDAPRATVETLQNLINDYSSSVHLAMVMGGSLYKQVRDNYGEHSPEYLAMQALNNNTIDPQTGLPDGVPYKLLRALQLLNINIPPQNIRYNNTINTELRKGGSGYIIDHISPDDLRTIEEITEFQANRFAISPENARALYETIANLDPAAGEELRGLNNEIRPDKLETALALLGIDYRRVEFNGHNGYIAYMSPLEQAKMRVIFGTIDNKDDRERTANYRPQVIQPGFKTTRGYMIQQIRQRARMLDQPAPPNPPANGGHNAPGGPPGGNGGQPPVPPMNNPLPPVANAPLNNGDRARIEAMLIELINNIALKRNDRHSWFTFNTDKKIDKLTAILNWVSEPQNAFTVNHRNIVLAMIRDVCATKRNPIGFFSPHSLNEFNARVNTFGINPNEFARFQFTSLQLDDLNNQPTAVTDLIGAEMWNMTFGPQR